MEQRVNVICGIKDYSEMLELYEKGALDWLVRPIRDLVKPGDKVVIKPNFVKESHLYRSAEWEQIITNGAVINLVLRETVKALKGEGKIFLIDAPQTDSDYEKIISRIGLPQLVDSIQKTTSVKISHFDLREERWFFRDGVIVRKKKLPGDPLGYTAVNLFQDSAFASKKNKDYYGADYDRDETQKYHNDRDNIYIISNTVLECDVFINLPKLKTHKLAGITCCMKNLVGICVIKNSLPHFTLGNPDNGGDQFVKKTGKTQAEGRLKLAALKLLRYKNPLINYPFVLLKKFAGVFLGSARTETIRNGMWFGNDTIWRTVVDLNRILFYADKEGRMQDTIQRRYIAFVDGIIAGEGNGPMEAEVKKAGILLSGTNPVTVDAVAAIIMGFDFQKILTIRNGFLKTKWPLTSACPEEIKIISNRQEWQKPITTFSPEDSLRFKPHFGWQGHIEVTENKK